MACIYPDVYLPIYLDALGVRPKTGFHFSAGANPQGHPASLMIHPHTYTVSPVIPHTARAATIRDRSVPGSFNGDRGSRYPV